MDYGNDNYIIDSSYGQQPRVTYVVRGIAGTKKYDVAVSREYIKSKPAIDQNPVLQVIGKIQV
jgi:hypothetical protein